jgi:hypothetical protein
MNPSTTAETRRQGPSKSSARLKWARQWHHYLWTMFAPSIIFFAFTGSLQLFGLHESHPGDAYQAPAWERSMGFMRPFSCIWPRRIDSPQSGD